MTRDQAATTAISAIVGGLVLLPPLALLAAWVLRSGDGKGMRNAVLSSAALLATLCAMAWSGVGPSSRLAGCFLTVAGYGAFCFLVASAPLARPRALGRAVAAAGWTVVALGYAAATIGFLPLAWIALGFVGPPWASEAVAPGMMCETTGWGMAASASGYVQHIYEAWPLGLRREVAAFSVMQTEPADPELSCAEALGRYRATSGR